MQELNFCLSLISQIEGDLVSPFLDTLVSIVEALEIKDGPPQHQIEAFRIITPPRMFLAPLKP